MSKGSKPSKEAISKAGQVLPRTPGAPEDRHPLGDLSSVASDHHDQGLPPAVTHDRTGCRSPKRYPPFRATGATNDWRGRSSPPAAHPPPRPSTKRAPKTDIAQISRCRHNIPLAVGASTLPHAR